jgi:hypothetical protein
MVIEPQCLFGHQPGKICLPEEEPVSEVRLRLCRLDTRPYAVKIIT